MGTRELRDAFNQTSKPACVCSAARLNYIRAGGEQIEYQVITFIGTWDNGDAFEVTSERLPAESDIMAAARSTAQKLVESRSNPA